MNDDVQNCLVSVRKATEYVDERVEILTSTKPNKSLARNELCYASKGEILVFIDSDAEPSDFWLHELLKPFWNARVGVVGGCHILKQTATKKEELADKILSFPLATWKSASRYKVSGKIRVTDESELTSCNMAVRRKAFMEAGGFPLEFIPCEENVLLNNIQKLGYKMIYNPLAIVYHNRDELFLPHLRKIHYYARGRGRIIRHGKGGLKLFPRPSLELFYLGTGLFLHYIAYISGLIRGLLS